MPKKKKRKNLLTLKQEVAKIGIAMVKNQSLINKVALATERNEGLVKRVALATERNNDQIAKLGLTVVGIQETMATKQDILATRQDITEIRHRLILIEETKADKSDLQRVEASLKKDIDDLGQIVQRSMEIHNKTHEQIEVCLAKLETTRV